VHPQIEKIINKQTIVFILTSPHHNKECSEKLSYSACVIASKRSLRGNLSSINFEIASSLCSSQ